MALQPFEPPHDENCKLCFPSLQRFEETAEMRVCHLLQPEFNVLNGVRPLPAVDAPIYMLSALAELAGTGRRLDLVLRACDAINKFPAAHPNAEAELEALKNDVYDCKQQAVKTLFPGARPARSPFYVLSEYINPSAQLTPYQYVTQTVVRFGELVTALKAVYASCPHAPI